MFELPGMSGLGQTMAAATVLDGVGAASGAVGLPNVGVLHWQAIQVRMNPLQLRKVQHRHSNIAYVVTVESCRLAPSFRTCKAPATQMKKLITSVVRW